MATHGKFVIFRMPDDPTKISETDIDDKIEVEGDAEIPDDKTKLVMFKPVMSRFKTSNPAPFSETNTKPDTGFEGTKYEVHLLVVEEDGTASGSIERLRDWFRETNKLRGKYKHGRFGIRNDYRPELNLTPNNEAGYKLVHVEIDQDLNINSLISIFLILEFSGDPSNLGT